jgi:NAD(P)-dependent dehydrogenase (short-subunit alcohol dehydrogenase family)
MWKSFTKTWHNEPYAQISPTRPELQATDKIVFITGGGTGIGKATAIAFAQAGAAAVAIFGRRLNKLEAAAEELRNAATNPNFKAIIESVDLSQAEATREAFTRALRQSGADKLHVYISNAASAAQFGKLVGYEGDELRKNLELNTIGTFNALQAALPLLSTEATVIDVNSGIGHIRPIPSVWLYASIKAMNIKMFRYLQDERPELSVFSLQPGVVETEVSAGSDFAGQDKGTSAEEW